MKKVTVPLKKIIDEFSLECIYSPSNPEDINIESTDINRPGLQFAGFYDFFDSMRIQMLGKVEHSLLGMQNSDLRISSINELFKHKFPALIVTRGLDIFPEMINAAEKYDIFVLRTNETTSAFMAALIAFLNLQLAPCITCHGVFVEVYGEGILMMGESGIGKSETAMELLKRGHRLIADDAVDQLPDCVRPKKTARDNPES